MEDCEKQRAMSGFAPVDEVVEGASAKRKESARDMKYFPQRVG